MPDANSHHFLSVLSKAVDVFKAAVQLEKELTQVIKRGR